MPEPSTAAIYDAASDRWTRNEPVSLSDYTGRPKVFELCGDVSGKKLIDLGCGEGYCARVMMERDAAEIQGIDVSPNMIKSAQAAAKGDKRQNYQVGSITEIPFDDKSFDLAMGVFVYNYLNVEETFKSFQEVFRVLKPGGTFVFSVPHPSFPLAQPEQVKPFYFDFGDKGYFTARNVRTFGTIFRRDGAELPVEMNHKLVEDYMDGLANAGFSNIPVVRELRVLEEHLEVDREFFEPLWDKPLHMAFKTIKPL